MNENSCVRTTQKVPTQSHASQFQLIPQPTLSQTPRINPSVYFYTKKRKLAYFRETNKTHQGSTWSPLSTDRCCCSKIKTLTPTELKFRRIFGIFRQMWDRGIVRENSKQTGFHYHPRKKLSHFCRKTLFQTLPIFKFVWSVLCLCCCLSHSQISNLKFSHLISAGQK